MSRTVPINVLSAAQSTATKTLAWAVVVTRADAQVFRWTSHDADVTISSNLYTSAPGIDIKSLSMSSGFGVDNTEVEVIEDDDITRADILAGRWDAAAFTLGLFNWKVPADGIAVFMTGTLGTFKPRDVSFVTELRDLRQALQQDTTDVVQADCRYRLGDAKCTIDLNESDGWVVNGSVTSSPDRYTVVDTSRTEADDFFGAGEIQFTSGLNSGLRFLVGEYDGPTDTFSLALPTPFTITAGDTYTAIAGCRKRDIEDCRDKFDNIINFGGEPHKARIDKLLAGAL